MPTSKFLRFANAERIDEELLSRRTSMIVGVASFLTYFYFRFHALKLKIVVMAPSLSLRGLKAGPSKLLTARFRWKLSGVK